MTGSALQDRIPVIPRGVKLRFDKTRGQWFLLGPERVFEPDEIAVEILQRIDGKRSLAGISAELCQAFDAPLEEITPDVDEFVRMLVGIRMLAFAGDAP
jgi:pyrroloquinoline quinone biosynthesis protein D